jgi:hypothetical protein
MATLVTDDAQHSSTQALGNDCRQLELLELIIIHLAQRMLAFRSPCGFVRASLASSSLLGRQNLLERRDDGILRYK